MGLETQIAPEMQTCGLVTPRLDWEYHLVWAHFQMSL